MSDAVPERKPRTQPALGGRPPGSPKIAAGDPEDWPADHPGKTIYLLDQVVVRDLAAAMGVKPFKIVAELLALERSRTPTSRLILKPLQ